MLYRIAQKIIAQKNRFLGRDTGLVSPKNVDYIVELSYVPSSEKTTVKENILQGAV